MSAREVISEAVEDWFLNPNDEYVDGAANRILSALRSAGWAVVPVEPTGEMRRAGENAPNTRLASHVWRAMLKAAQEDSRE